MKEYKDFAVPVGNLVNEAVAAGLSPAMIIGALELACHDVKMHVFVLGQKARAAEVAKGIVAAREVPKNIITLK